MWKFTLSGALAWLLIADSGFAAHDQRPGGGGSLRQEVLEECNAEAKAKKLAGDAMRQFVDECIRANMQPSPQQVEQQKTTLCNRRAKQNAVQAHDRKNYVEDCVRASTEIDEQKHEKMLHCSRRATQERVSGEARKMFLDDCMKG
jgi:hypothetical protein